MVARLKRMAFTIPLRSPLTRVTSALSMATSVPVPIAIPTSAAAKAGASLIPSPAIATICFLSIHFFINAFLSLGLTSAL